MTSKFDSAYSDIVESTSKAPKGDSYDSQNNWKPSGVDSDSDGSGGRYRRTRPNTSGRSKATHGGQGVQDEEDHEPFDADTNSDYNTQESEEDHDGTVDITMPIELADVLHELLMHVVDEGDEDNEKEDTVDVAHAKGDINKDDVRMIKNLRPEEDAEYQGRKVSLNKPTRGDVKKFKVYVKDPKTGNVKKVNFGHGGTSAKSRGEKTMKIRKSNPKARKSFRARHNCDNPGSKLKPRYWSCRKW